MFIMCLLVAVASMKNTSRAELTLDANTKKEHNPRTKIIADNFPWQSEHCNPLHSQS